MCESLFIIKTTGIQPAILFKKKRLCRRFFLVNFAKVQSTPFIQNSSGRLLFFFAMQLLPQLPLTLRRWLLVLLLNFHYNAQVFTRQLQRSLVPKPLPFSKNADDILSKKENLGFNFRILSLKIHIQLASIYYIDSIFLLVIYCIKFFLSYSFLAKVASHHLSIFTKASQQHLLILL